MAYYRQISSREKICAGFFLILFTVLPVFILLAYWPNKMPEPGKGNDAWYTTDLFKTTLIEGKDSINIQERNQAIIRAIDSLNEIKISLQNLLAIEKDSTKIKADSVMLIAIDAQRNAELLKLSATDFPSDLTNDNQININTILLILVAAMGFLGNMVHIASSFTAFVGNGTFRKSWTLWYFVRPFTAAGLALVVYFIIRAGFLNYGSDAGSVSLYGILSLAALAGLFTDNATLKLKEVFDVIFKPKDERKDKLTNETSQSETSEGTIPDEIFREALEEKGQEWKDKYAPVESISIGKKKIDGVETEQWCLQFNVTVKQEDVPEERKIPHFIEYTSKKNEKYSLPTDVNGVGKTTNDSCYVANSDIVTGVNLSVKLLGISCSRKANTNTGTIGLKVKKDGKKYLLSCYHVLCAEEIKANKFELKETEATTNPEVISPGLFDGGSNTALANLKEGFIDDQLDVAIAELTDENLLADRIYGTATHASTIFVVDSSHVRQDYKITMVGRTSGKQIGHLESAFANVTVRYPTNQDSENKIELKGVLMACKISVPGDSGAAVFDEKNNIIGIVFASNDANTYILPIETVLNKLQVSLS